LVGASNFAAACETSAKLELMLLDPGKSAAGLALRTRRPVQSSLLNGARQFSLQLGDVAAMAEAAPAVKLVLCLPFAPAQPRAEQEGHGVAALQGAVLLGTELESPPSKRCMRGDRGARASLGPGRASWVQGVPHWGLLGFVCVAEFWGARGIEGDWDLTLAAWWGAGVPTGAKQLERWCCAL
jgi:hypothetical protein